MRPNTHRKKIQKQKLTLKQANSIEGIILCEVVGMLILFFLFWKITNDNRSFFFFFFYFNVIILIMLEGKTFLENLQKVLTITDNLSLILESIVGWSFLTVKGSETEKVFELGKFSQLSPGKLKQLDRKYTSKKLKIQTGFHYFEQVLHWSQAFLFQEITLLVLTK